MQTLIYHSSGYSSLLFFVAEYAQVTKMLGNGRLEATCFDGTKRLCHIRGKLRKKVCLYVYAKNPNCVVLFGCSSLVINRATAWNCCGTHAWFGK